MLPRVFSAERLLDVLEGDSGIAFIEWALSVLAQFLEEVALWVSESPSPLAVDLATQKESNRVRRWQSPATALGEG